MKYSTVSQGNAKHYYLCHGTAQHGMALNNADFRRHGVSQNAKLRHCFVLLWTQKVFTSCILI
jgi:hypothetical protein